MTKIIEAAIEAFSPLKPDKKVTADYDEPEDVLYVNFVDSPPEEAAFGRMFGDYIIRFRKDGLVVGITILNAMKHSEKGFQDKPSVLQKPITLYFV